MTEKKKRIVQAALAAGFLAAGILGFVAFKAARPEIEKTRPALPLPAVKTVSVQTGTNTVRILGEGTVNPSREILLVSEVVGKVVEVSPSLADGGQFRKGATLLRIDPADYRLAVTLAEAKVRDAESFQQLTEEEAGVALEEWRMFPRDGSDPLGEPPPLVVKEPQLAAAQAALEAARADLKKARLNLDRCEIKAPFDGRVAEESVDVGQYVAPGQSLASLYATDKAEIEVPLEMGDLFWFHVPGFTPGDGPGASATVRANVAGRELSWPGRVVRSNGRLDARTRMINVVVAVDRPYARRPPLIVGLFVSVEIGGSTMAGSALIPRVALHQGDVVWVVDSEDRLSFRKVDVARVQGDRILVRAGLESGEKVVVSPLSSATDGMRVRSYSDRDGSGPS